uniref:Protein hunchback (Fragments) n=1 Tax=Scaptomyza crassifemur TaxID=13053 RepID=HUNB_SCACA|nr:RecName: Full=Protein hunchback [Scaptomyza crassifemur]
WYSSMFAANIKQEPMSHHHHHSHHHGHHHMLQHSNSNRNASSPRQSPLPSPNPPSSSNLHLEQYLKQQHQQHQQQQQQPMDTLCAAAMTPSPSNNDQNSPLTPPGLPNPMQIIMPANMRPATQPTPTIATPTTTSSAIVALQTNDKLQALTPPMDVTPPKSPAKSQQSCAEPEKDHDLISNSSEDMKYMA